MGSLLRSEDMVLVRMVFDEVAGHDTVDELGKVGMFQFVDENEHESGFQRHFAPNVRRCEELQRCMRFLEKELASIDMEPLDDFTEISEDELRFEELEEHLGKLEKNLNSINGNMGQLKSQYTQLLEKKHVLEKGREFFKHAPATVQSSYGSMELNADMLSNIPKLSVKSLDRVDEETLLSSELVPVKVATPDMLDCTMGVLNLDRMIPFDRVLFRASRGNAYSRFAEVEEKLYDVDTGEPVEKVVFIIFHFGDQMRKKVDKICQAFRASVYEYPETDFPKVYRGTVSRLKDLEKIIETTEDHRRRMLADLMPKIAPWNDYIMREKAIYHALNLVKTDQKLYVASGWAPANKVDKVRSALDIGRKRSHSQVHSMIETQTMDPHIDPPTYFELNKFTTVFQGVVESYSVAQYKEINPAPFAVVSFPFLFAVMFGDVGHGIIMAIVAYMIIRMEDKLKGKKLDDITGTLYDGRYIIFMMGLFSIFTGLIYNECFAVPLNFFGSRWKFTEASEMACGIDNCADPAAVHAPIAPYPFGFDPVWKSAKTGLLFFNSYKMKLSILLGVAQMLLGICLSYGNARFFQKPLDVWYIFVPQMVFINSIFGYLCILILLKWSINYDAPVCRADPNCVPPDLKAILISMIMQPGTLDPKLKMFAGQEFIQTILLSAALVSVPIMLLAKPLILRSQHAKLEALEARPLLDVEGGPSHESHEHGGHDDEEGFNFGDEMVQNMIHTIEFVLGCVSNTASYLRLWALSLAHAELSDVFLDKLVFLGAETGSPLVMIICFFFWMAMTLGVLMLMESLSAFLHTLRLHWVEFQNKFYSLHGPGAKFMPFSYEEIRKGD